MKIFKHVLLCLLRKCKATTDWFFLTCKLHPRGLFTSLCVFWEITAINGLWFRCFRWLQLSLMTQNVTVTRHQLAPQYPSSICPPAGKPPNCAAITHYTVIHSTDMFCSRHSGACKRHKIKGKVICVGKNGLYISKSKSMYFLHIHGFHLCLLDNVQFYLQFTV